MIKIVMLLFLLFLNPIMCSCLQQDIPGKTINKNTENVSLTDASAISSKIINENLDNYSLRDASEDVGSFRGNVYSIKKYVSDDDTKKRENDRIIDGKTLHSQHFIIYRKDGRRSYRKEISGDGSSIKKYYYDEPSGNLILKEDNYDKEYGKSEYSEWIFYNKKSNYF